MSHQVYLKSLGCRLNEAELAQWTHEFTSKGFGITAEPEQADCFVINTCAVTQEAVRKSRKVIRQLQQKQPLAKTIASGCYLSLSPEEGETLGLDLMVANHQKSELVTKTVDLLGEPAAPSQLSTDWSSGIYSRGRSRAFIKAQDGCRYQCTFCIVTHARGEEKSKPIADIIDEINRYHQAGIQEVVISGVHLGGYGSDINSNLSELLAQVLAETSVPRIRLGSVEPWGLTDDFFALYADSRMMPHLHLPLQSGSDQILKKMARRCKRQSFLDLVDQAVATIPNFTLSTDIIVGFPGETEQDFALSLSALAELPLLHAHIFPYSTREGTRAATLPEQIAGDIKKARSKIMHQQAEQQQLKTLQNYLGKQEQVLWEQKVTEITAGQPNAVKYLHGHTRNFMPVVIAAEPPQIEQLKNTITTVQLTSIEDKTAVVTLC